MIVSGHSSFMMLDIDPGSVVVMSNTSLYDDFSILQMRGCQHEYAHLATIYNAIVMNILHSYIEANTLPHYYGVASCN